jgi:uncharacterized Zn-binding protein involved in type VI secretion
VHVRRAARHDRDGVDAGDARREPAARMGDMTAHRGVIVVGAPTVQIN